MQIGASFDTSLIRKKGMCFHNLVETKHYVKCESDYNLLRDHGFTLFRDSAYFSLTFVYSDWHYLDRLAKLSNGQIMLNLLHYEMPYMPGNTERMVAYGEFIDQVARRYAGAFHSYVPVVESGYWCHMMSKDDWLPHFDDWWQAFDHVSEITAFTAATLKNADPDCLIAMVEPFYNRNMYENTQPFDTLLGRHDELADANGCHSWMLGDNGLLDIIGLNMYNQDNIRGLIQQAEQHWPGKRLMITETNSNYTRFGVAEYMEHLKEQMAGTSCEAAIINPAIQMATFYDGSPITHGYLFDQQRRKAY